MNLDIVLLPDNILITMLIKSAMKNSVMTALVRAACVCWYVNTDIIIWSMLLERLLGVRMINIMMLVSKRRK